MGTFVFAICRWFNFPGIPIQSWDQNDYYHSAALFYESPTLQNLWFSPRPNYMWLPAIFLKALKIPLTSSRISFVTAALAWALLIGSLFQASKLLKSGTLFLLFSLSLLCSLPVTFLYSVEMMADFSHAATFIALIVASLNLVKNGGKSKTSFLIYFMVGCFGLFTKPVFFMPALVVTGVTAIYSLIEPAFSNKTKLKISFVAMAYIALTLFVAFHYSPLISSLYFNNEVLGYWIRSKDVFFQLFWYPIELFENLCLGHLIGFFVLTMMWVFKGNSTRKLKDFRLMLLVWCPWILMMFYTSLVVKQKDIRVFLFLFVFLFVFFPLSIGKAIQNRSKKIEYLMTALIVINSLVAISLTFPDTFYSFLARNFKFTQRKWVHAEYLKQPITFQQAKIDDIFEIVHSDCLKRKKLCSPPHLSVFLPHSAQINSSLFNDYSIFVKRNFKSFIEWTPSWKVQNGLFRFGGWFHSGGIPVSFFNSYYIVYYSSMPVTHLKSDAEFYNKVFYEHLSSQNPVFLDGLEEIANLKSELGPIHILRRNRIPSSENFIKLVQLFQTIDTDNWWNHPYLDAVDKLQKKSPNLSITNFERLKAKETIPTYTQVWNFPPPGDYFYPDLFNKINLNP